MFTDNVRTMKKALVLLVALIAVISVYADVGVGVSPSKTVIQVEGGEVHELTLLVFNSGDDPLEITLSTEGNIASFTTVETKKILVDPEPKPHELPIKNGKEVKVRMKPPATSKPVTYTGTINAVGSVATGQQFGGSVGVATQIEVQVTPSKSFWAFVTTTHLLIGAILLVLLALFLLLRRMGLHIRFEK